MSFPGRPAGECGKGIIYVILVSTTHVTMSLYIYIYISIEYLLNQKGWFREDEN